MSQSSPPPRLRRGARPLPGYRVLGLLHRGGDADVYDAWSDERASRCTLKLLRPDRLADAGARGALLREGRLLLRLSHPHLVRAYALIPRPHPALVLETLPGATLEHLIAAGRLPGGDLVWLGLHLCSACTYLHRQGYLHLDLKPSNIVADRGLAKILDLNIARKPGRTRPGIGTRSYMAPEQARGDLLSPATDVWGIGAVLFEAAAGRLPFELRADGPRYPQLESRAPPIGRYRRLPRPLAEAIDACLEPDPARRPTLAELMRALDRLARGAPSSRAQRSQ